MPSFPVRRSQLISPFGVGALQVIQDGSSVITAGLDHWFRREDGSSDSNTIDLQEFMLEEWRLEQLLGVDYFMLPPDSRMMNSGGEPVPNSRLTVPFLKFPQWHFCPRCKILKQFPLTTQRKQKCTECSKNGNTSYMVQVPIVAICEHGHIQDFPWREWVHRSANPRCNGPLSLIATGGASLAAQKIVCGNPECGAERTLASITSANPDGSTFLSKNLEGGDSDFVYMCRGLRPWLHDQVGNTCTKHLRGSLRSAANLYFADVKSAIYIPRGDGSVSADLIEILEQPEVRTLVRLLAQVGSLLPEAVRQYYREILQPYSDQQLEQAFRIITGQASSSKSQAVPVVISEDPETAFRRSEYEVLSEPRDDKQLTISRESLQNYDSAFREYFDKVLLIPRLIETRAFTGFSRIYPENELSPEQHRFELRREQPQPGKSWLPAYRVYGEGIFLMVNEARLRQWETEPIVQKRIRPLVDRYKQLQEERHLRDRPLSPRFVLLHTISHLLINQLTFECGYSTAALRERLYISVNEIAPMSGILIYTASGDAEGTLGGLVRMGRAGYLEPLFARAIDKAAWCSADPVCMEIGSSAGQGPDSCNLAACHNCSLVPETSCEEFNRFLDRALVVGEPGANLPGFLSVA